MLATATATATAQAHPATTKPARAARICHGRRGMVLVSSRAVLRQPPCAPPLQSSPSVNVHRVEDDGVVDSRSLEVRSDFDDFTRGFVPEAVAPTGGTSPHPMYIPSAPQMPLARMRIRRPWARPSACPSFHWSPMAIACKIDRSDAEKRGPWPNGPAYSSWRTELPRPVGGIRRGGRVRLHHRGSRRRGVRAGEPPEREPRHQGAPRRGGRFGSRPDGQDPQGPVLPARRRQVRVQLPDVAGRPQQDGRALDPRQAARRLDVHQRDAVSPRRRLVLGRAGAARQRRLGLDAHVARLPRDRGPRAGRHRHPGLRGPDAHPRQPPARRSSRRCFSRPPSPPA